MRVNISLCRDYYASTKCHHQDLNLWHANPEIDTLSSVAAPPKKECWSVTLYSTGNQIYAILASFRPQTCKRGQVGSSYCGFIGKPIYSPVHWSNFDISAFSQINETKRKNLFSSDGLFPRYRSRRNDTPTSFISPQVEKFTFQTNQERKMCNI